MPEVRAFRQKKKLLRLNNMNIFQNLDLLSVGIVIASSGMLGFSVYFNNTSSVTNKTFLTFSIITLIWGGTNYLFYQIHNPEISIWFLRVVLFFAVWQAFIIFQLFFVFPSKKTTFPKWYKYILIPVVILTSILMLTPLGIEGVKELSPEGRIIKAHNGQAIPLFGLLGIFLVVGGLYAFIRKAKRAINSERKSYWFILTGTAITFALIIIFNLILPSAFDDSRFIPLGALFVFPLIAFTSYAILRHKLFNIKIAAVGIFTFLLSIVTFLEIIFARDLSQIIFRSSIFIFVLIFGIMLIKTVLKEVRLREEIETLAETLQKTNTRLKELDRLKSEFVSFDIPIPVSETCKSNLFLSSSLESEIVIEPFFVYLTALSIRFIITCFILPISIFALYFFELSIFIINFNPAPVTFNFNSSAVLLTNFPKSDSMKLYFIVPISIRDIFK